MSWINSVTSSAGNFFQRDVMPELDKLRDAAADQAASAWKQAAPVLEVAKDKAVPLLEKAWDKSSPVLEKAWDKSAPVRDVVADVRDDVRDTAVSTWNHVPGNETAEKLVGDLTDRLPFNNAAKASLEALFGAKEITLDKDATDGIQKDPDFLAKEKQINADVQSAAKADPRYGKTEFDISLSDLYKSQNKYPESEGRVPLGLGGESGQSDKWDQARHFYDLDDPDVKKTWQVAANEQSWLLRHCQLDGTAHVAKDGTVTIDYKVTDTLDLSPHGKVDDAYDVVSKGLGTVWHGVLGAEAPDVTGTFTRTVPS